LSEFDIVKIVIAPDIDGLCRGAGGPETPTGAAMSDESPRYLAYMLRLWQVEAEEGPAWRALLESPHSGERRGFANLELLFAFLEEKTGELAQGEVPAKDITV
jgi:hypothetical protein